MTTTNRTPVFVSKPYAASLSSTACSNPRSPVKFTLPAPRPAPEPALVPPAFATARAWKMSRVLERRRENCNGVRRGCGRGRGAFVVEGRYIGGKRVMCSGLDYDGLVRI